MTFVRDFYVPTKSNQFCKIQSLPIFFQIFDEGRDGYNLKQSFNIVWRFSKSLVLYISYLAFSLLNKG